MVGAGFRLEEVYDMTLDQLNLFTTSVIKRSKLDQLTYMDQVRFAFHADQKDYQKQTRELRRDMK